MTNLAEICGVQQNLIITRDGSHTIAIDGKDIFYHSIHGAIQESMHVFINAGLRFFMQNKKPAALAILEVGMGTGLNVLLTLAEEAGEAIPITYTALEPHPISTEHTASLNYGDTLERPDLKTALSAVHAAPWNEDHLIRENFTLHKIQTELHATQLPYSTFDIIYFDAFAPSAQPEMWDQRTFAQLLQSLRPGGILLTYCSKTVVRKAMMAAGFAVKKIQGPFGKREMVRASKSDG